MTTPGLGEPEELNPPPPVEEPEPTHPPYIDPPWTGNDVNGVEDA